MSTRLELSSCLQNTRKNCACSLLDTSKGFLPPTASAASTSHAFRRTGASEPPSIPSLSFILPHSFLDLFFCYRGICPKCERSKLCCRDSCRFPQLLVILLRILSGLLFFSWEGFGCFVRFPDWAPCPKRKTARAKWHFADLYWPWSLYRRFGTFPMWSFL